MREARISSLVVRGRPPGLVTASDLRDRVLAAGLSGEVRVQAVMSAPLHTMPADAALGEVLLCTVDHGIHHLPLVREGRLVGMVTDTDLAAAFEYLQDLRLRHQAGRLQGRRDTRRPRRARAPLAQGRLPAAAHLPGGCPHRFQTDLIA